MKLTREQQQAIVRAKGLERRRRLERLVQGDAFAGIPEDRQRRLIQRTLADASEAVTRRAPALLARQQAVTEAALTAQR